MVTTGLTSLLNADATVDSLLSGRIYEVFLPRQFQYPAVVFHRYGTAPSYTFAGPEDVVDVMIQYDVYGSDASSTRNTVEAIKNVLNSFTGALSSGETVQAIYLQTDMDMPANAQAGVVRPDYRVVLQFRVVHTA